MTYLDRTYIFKDCKNFAHIFSLFLTCFIIRSLNYLAFIVMFEYVVKNLTLPLTGLAFDLSFWEVISKLLNVMPGRSILVCLGAWGRTGQSNCMIYGRG